MKPYVVSEYVDYLTHERQLSPRTVTEYKRDLATFLLWCQNAVVIPLEATYEEVRSFIRNLSKKGEVKNSTIKRAVASLKVFYKWAKMDGHATVDAAYYLKSPKIEKCLPVYLSEAETERLELYLMQGSGITHLQRRVVVFFLLCCGLRARELSSMQLHQIETDKSGRPLRIKVKGKGNKERLLPVPEKLVYPLWDWLQHRKRLQIWDYARKYSRVESYIKSPYLIPGTEGDEISYIAINKTVRKACKNTGITVVTPHKLRHTFATHLLWKNAPLTVIQKALGHESIATTQIYTHVEQKSIDEWVGGRSVDDINKPVAM